MKLRLSDEEDSKIEDNSDDINDNSKGNDIDVEEIIDDDFNDKTDKRSSWRRLLTTMVTMRMARRMMLAKVAKVLNTNN